MKRLPLTFTLAILLPAVVLGGLALRSARQQHAVIEAQAVDLYETITDRLALRVRHAMEEKELEFETVVDALLVQRPAAELVWTFSAELARSWPDARVGFAVTMDGRLLTPGESDPGGQQFLAENGSFLTNRAPADFSQAVANTPTTTGRDRMTQTGSQQQSMRTVTPAQTKKSRKQEAPTANNASARPLPFQALAAGGESGSVSRFVGEELELLLWKRTDAGIVFGSTLRPAEMQELWQELLAEEVEPDREICLVLLDERGAPVARSLPDHEAEWDRPFVASRVGASLPLWEAAIYLTDPGGIAARARIVQTGLVAMIVVAVGAIAVGGLLLARDTRRRLEWARLKSEFVSNVSHELKTPLTSIRMFAELLGRRPTDGDKAREFARVIRLESERLSRLVENVLDFDKLQRGERDVAIVSFDAAEVVDQVWETIDPTLRARGFTTCREAGEPPYPVRGEPDAVSQILVNLLSNAEKFAGERREITLRTALDPDALRIEVLDRGPGVAAARAEAIFEPFVHQGEAAGSGLGLYIARELAQAQGGSLTYLPRDGGGSRFTLRLPRDDGGRP